MAGCEASIRGISPRVRTEAALQTKLDEELQTDASAFCALLKTLQQSDSSATVVHDEQFSITAVQPADQHPLRLAVGQNTCFFFAARVKQEEEQDAGAEAPKSISQVHVGTSLPDGPGFLLSDEGERVVEEGLTEMRPFDASGIVPMQLDEARHLLSLFNLAGDAFLCSWPLLCLSSDGGSDVVCMGMSQPDSTTLSSYIFTQSGSPSTAKEVPKLHDIVVDYTSQQVDESESKVNLKAFSVYDVRRVAEDSATESSLFVHFFWEDPQSTLAPPPYSANALLRVRAVPGDARSETFSTLQDLERLGNMLGVSEAIDGGADLMSLRLGGPGTCAKDAAVFVDTLEAELGVAAMGGADDNVGASPLSVLTARTDLDFTERLWAIIKAAGTLGDLKKGMGCIFEAVRMGTIQPILHRNNTCELATVARQCLKSTRSSDGLSSAQLQETLGRLAQPSQCMKAVIEVGLLKMRQDLAHHFIGQELATATDLGHYTDISAPLHEQVAKLKKLVNVLELFVVTKSYADAPHAGLRALVSAALQFYKSHDCTDHAVFQLPMPAFSASASKVKRLCSSTDPDFWSLSMSGDRTSPSLVQFTSTRGRVGLQCLVATSAEMGQGNPVQGDLDAATKYHQCRASTSIFEK